MVKMNNISGPNWKFGAADCWLRGTKSDPGAERVPSHPKIYGNMPQNRKKCQEWNVFKFDFPYTVRHS